MLLKVFCLAVLFVISESFTADTVNNNVLPEETVIGAEIKRADEALLQLSYSLRKLSFSFRSRRCYKCQLVALDNDTPKAYFVNTRFPYDFYFYSKSVSNTTTCYINNFEFEAGKTYWIDIDTDSDGNLECSEPTATSTKSSHNFLGALYGIVYAAVLLMVFLVTRALYVSGTIYFILPNRSLDNNIITDLGNPEADRVSNVPSINDSQQERSLLQSQQRSTDEVKTKSPKKRVKSLDCFRGIAIVLMIFVNYGGGGYWFFDHSSWNGLTVADLLFPWFIFIMGMSVPVAMRKVSFNEMNMNATDTLLRAMSRSAVLICFGLVISNKDVSSDHIRIMGVLQRIGISYCCVSVMEIITAKYVRRANLNTLSSRMGPPVWFHAFLDLYPFWIQWVIMSVVVTAWLLITFLVHDEGCPRGYLGPGGWQNAPDYQVLNCTGGAAGLIDRTILGHKHVYQNPTAKNVYGPEVMPYDPEGFLGCLTSIFLTFLGVQAGRIMLIYSEWKSIVCRWLIWAFVTGALAAGLCGFTLNDGVLPINKNIWSLSFILATASLAYISMSILYMVVDQYHFWDGQPFVYAGMNSILLYMGHELLQGFFPFSWGIEYPSHTVFMLENVSAVTMWIIIAGMLYRKKLFLKV